MPIIVDEDDVVVAGHTRLRAAIKLSLQTVPVVRASHLTAEQARAFRLADNRLAEMTTWDDHALALILQDMGDVATEIPGFDDAYIEQALAALEDESRTPDITRPAPGAPRLVGQAAARARKGTRARRGTRRPRATRPIPREGSRMTL